jgi:hypothetical protein
MEGTFLRYYLWSIYGLAFGMMARSLPATEVTAPRNTLPAPAMSAIAQ